jgi:hypothetical protein
MSLQEIIQEIAHLSIEQRKTLIMVIAESLTESSKTHSLLELKGLGAELWQGVDAQTYIDTLRDEWDHRS